jgi:two-component system, cell cycle sensor histidine kinase and response regulator CckA
MLANTMREQTSSMKDAQELIERLPAVVYVADAAPELLCRYVSPQIEALLGYSPGEWTGDSRLWSQGVHSEDADKRPAAYTRSITTGQNLDVQYRMLDRRGNLVWIHDRAAVVRDEHGAPCRLYGVLVDVTTRRNAQTAFRQQEANLTALLDQLPIILWTTDSSLRLTSGRGGALRLLNLRGDELPNTTLYEYFGTTDDDSPFIAPHLRALAGETVSYEVTWQDRSYEARVEPVRDTSGQIVGVMGVATDVTERKQLEDRIRQAEKMEALGRLAGSVAHDFNNIMAVILNYARFLSEDLDEDQRLKDVSEILRAAERAKALINQLLTFSRAETSATRTVNINDVVSEMEGLLRRTIGPRIDLEIDCSQQLWPIQGDRGRIEHALLNLVLNARDAMAEGGTLRITTANEMRHRKWDERHARPPRERFVRLTVEDTGAGMTPDIAAHVFEPFFTTKAPGEGTGLGLASVYGIVEQSGGFVSVDSTVGKGSAFHLYFPACEERVALDRATAAL